MVGIPGGPACQSCGSPMANAKEHGGGKESVPYCKLCTDKSGNLLPYGDVHERMTTERFMKVNGMPRKGAEEAARRALMHMPAWQGRV